MARTEFGAAARLAAISCLAVGVLVGLAAGAAAQAPGAAAANEGTAAAVEAGPGAGERPGDEAEGRADAAAANGTAVAQESEAEPTPAAPSSAPADGAAEAREGASDAAPGRTRDDGPQEAPAAQAGDATVPGGDDAGGPAAGQEGDRAEGAAGDTVAAPALGALAADDELVIGVLDDSPPFSTIGRFGARRGFDVDLAYAVCARLEVRCRLATVKQAGIAEALTARRVDAVVASDAALRPLQDVAEFTVPYVRLAARYVMPRDGAPRDLEADTTERYGAIRGTPYAGYLEQAYPAPGSVWLYDTSEGMWIDLALGRLDAVLATAVTARTEFLSTPLGRDFSLSFNPVADPDVQARDVSIAVHRGDSALIGALNAALADVLASSDYQEAVSRHLGGGLVEIPEPALSNLTP